MALLTVFGGCVPDPPSRRVPVTSRERIEGRDDPVPAGRISKAEAIAIAKRRLAGSPHADLFNPEVFFVAYDASRDVFRVDFRNVDRMGDEMRPGLWGAGFVVVVKGRSGEVESANGYKR